MKQLLLFTTFLFMTPLFCQLDYERNFFKNSWHMDGEKITSQEAEKILSTTELSKDYLKEAQRSRKIFTISAYTLAGTTLINTIERVRLEEGENISILHGISSILSTVSFITTLVTNSRSKKRFRKATAAYNSISEKTGFNPNLILMPNKLGVSVRF